jgi:hypothetical protein
MKPTTRSQDGKTRCQEAIVDDTTTVKESYEAQGADRHILTPCIIG